MFDFDLSPIVSSERNWFAVIWPLPVILKYYAAFPPPNDAAGRLARLDASPSGIRTVAGSILRLGNILSWR